MSHQLDQQPTTGRKRKMSFGLSESTVAKFTQAQTPEQDADSTNGIGRALEGDQYRHREVRTKSYHPLAEHIGPFHQGSLYVDPNNPGHQRVMYHCSSNAKLCPGCYAEHLDDKKARLEILTASTIYLEQHILTTEKEVENLQAAERRKTGSTGALAVIPVADNKFYVITPIRLGGRALKGEGRIDRVNCLVDKSMKRREKGQQAVRFNNNWPKLEKPPKRLEQVASSPDTIMAGDAPKASKGTAPKALDTPILNEEELIALAEEKLQRFEGVAVVQRGMTFSGSKGLRILDFWISLKTLINPLKHCHIHLSLGYHLSPTFYVRAKKWAENEIATRGAVAA